jgi:two-component system chemotaxis response regulator CheB
MPKIRVLVVEDSLTVRKHLVEVLNGDPDLQVVAEASDGKAAIELCVQLRPDVITLDMMLPVMSGLAATEYIMAHCPTPILIVSASTNRGELLRTYDALAAGAIEAIDKPRADTNDEAWSRKLVAAVKLVSRIKVITHLRGRLRQPRPVLVRAPAAEAARGRPTRRLVAMGASTGGPGAVLQILRALPATFGLPVVVIIHVGAAFASGLAEWLDGLSPLRVTFARDGELLPRDGRVLLAPAERHLVVERERLRLSDAPERHSCRPSVDVLFASLARELGPESIACLLTGMGKDGAAGLREIRAAGGLTVAQDEATSVVFGMPREAVALDAAEHVLPIDEIGPLLVRTAGSAQAAKR